MEADGFGTSVTLFLFWESAQKMTNVFCGSSAAARAFGDINDASRIC